MTPRVRLYVTNYCGYCRRAERLLDRKGIPYESIDVTHNRALRDEIEAQTGWETVPMIFIGDRFIGGCDDLHELEAAGELDAMLAAV